jgi:hypothetical protein
MYSKGQFAALADKNDTSSAFVGSLLEFAPAPTKSVDPIFPWPGLPRRGGAVVRQTTLLHQAWVSSSRRVLALCCCFQPAENRSNRVAVVCIRLHWTIGTMMSGLRNATLVRLLEAVLIALHAVERVRNRPLQPSRGRHVALPRHEGGRVHGTVKHQSSNHPSDREALPFVLDLLSLFWNRSSS